MFKKGTVLSPSFENHQDKDKKNNRMESDMDAMVSAKISLHTQGPERIRKSTPVHGNAVVDLHDWS